MAMIGVGLIVLPFIVEEAFFLDGAVEALTAEEASAGFAEAETAAGEASAAPAESRVYAIGKFDDTGGLNALRYERLNISGWTMEKNDAWIQKIIDSRANVRYFEPADASMLQDPVTGAETTLGREVRQFMNAGYKKSGGFLKPPSP